MPTYKPLAEILRPSSLAEFVGQRHLLDADKPIGKTLADGKLHSMILWGPPGSGKTTLARIICHQMGAHFEQMSAVLEGIKELRNVSTMLNVISNITKVQYYLLMKFIALIKHNKMPFYLTLNLD